MIKFVYGGDVTGVPLDSNGKPAPNNGVEMSVVSLDGITRTAIYSSDGADYLYTLWDIASMIVLVAPSAVSYSARQPGQLIISANSAIATDVAIRPLLMEPRKRLTMSFLSAFNEQQVGDAAEEILIDIPIPTGNQSSSQIAGGVDANIGPIPTKCNIIGPFGNGECLMYDYGIQFWVNEQNNYFGNPESKAPLLLSNRWTMSRQINEQGELAAYETDRVIEGEAIFRSDRLKEAIACPDQFTRCLVHPIPQGFRRNTIRVEAISNGTGVRYFIIDKQVPINLVAQNSPGAIKISATHTKMLVKLFGPI